MERLAMPYVFQCAWRSFWPTCYNARIAFWDTPLNSIFLSRSLATCGEICWTAMIAVGIIHCNKELHSYFKRVDRRQNHTVTFDRINFVAKLAVVLNTIANINCIIGMLTTNCFYNCIEVGLWVIALALLIPCSIVLY